MSRSHFQPLRVPVFFGLRLQQRLEKCVWKSRRGEAGSFFLQTEVSAASSFYAPWTGLSPAPATVPGGNRETPFNQKNNRFHFKSNYPTLRLETLRPTVWMQTRPKNTKAGRMNIHNAVPCHFHWLRRSLEISAKQIKRKESGGGGCFEELQPGCLMNARMKKGRKSAEQKRQFFLSGTHHVPRWSIKQGEEQINSSHSLGWCSSNHLINGCSAVTHGGGMKCMPAGCSPGWRSHLQQPCEVTPQPPPPPPQSPGAKPPSRMSDTSKKGLLLPLLFLLLPLYTHAFD